MLKITLKVVAFACLCLALAWVYAEPNKYDSWVAAAAAAVVFLGLFVPDVVRRRASQFQKIGNKSTGIQAGGNVTINIQSNKDKT